MSTTKLLIQPGTGIKPLLEGIDAAEHTIQIVIFRFDRGEIEGALKRAVRRGVFVHALVAHTMAGQGGAATLRKLELRLLADGVTVARTSSDLVRYHEKLMIIDKRELYMLGFNYTYLDIERSRSFGILTDHRTWVQEAEKLFMADTLRQQYSPGCDTFLVSPGNSRQQLIALLAGAKKELLIYDGKLSDPDVMRLLAAKVRSGVSVRVIGSAGKRAVGVHAVRSDMRLHAQAVVRDGEELFLGSQSLRSLELDARREVGLIIRDRAIVSQVASTFEGDWKRITSDQKFAPAVPADLVSIDEFNFDAPNAADPVSPELSIQIVKSAVKEAIKDAIMESVHENYEDIPLKSAVKDAAKEALVELAQ